MNDDHDDNLDNSQNDAIESLMMLLEYAIYLRDEDNTESNCADLFKEFIKPIIGNRNPDNINMIDILPDFYCKLIDYCAESVKIYRKKELQKLLNKG